MKIYLVGGAVRDIVMGIKSHDYDFVVVGASIQDMINMGYMPIGKNFPVFLHPVTKYEYALARTEKKVSKGYHGFEFYTDESVSLEQDLARRDLTINAMALPIDENHQPLSIDNLIDPFDGIKDIVNKNLKHVSHAFQEDPVRILRICRFSARYNFDIDNSTLNLMLNMVNSKEVNSLVPERVWQETQKALSEKYPYKFFEYLDKINALNIIFPYLDIENTFILKNHSINFEYNFCFLMLKLTIENIKDFCNKLKINNNTTDMAIVCKKIYDNYQIKAESILNILQITDSFRRQERFEKALDIIERYSDIYYKKFNKEILQKSLKQTKNIDIKNFLNNPSQIKKNVYMKRLEIIQNLLNTI